MNIFNVISLLGGLAMFLYGMRLMGDALKQNSSGTLKAAMGKVTDNPLKAFILGVLVTALIQSSTATIVITAGLVGAGILTLHQSLGIIIGANVGTTVTGQIIRLLDIDASGTSVLRFFQPSTLAPIALIIGIVLIMGSFFKNARSVGNIAIGFGILFSGLLNMTGAVNNLAQSGLIENLFFMNSPLHDGAMVIANQRIKAAGCILPVSHDLNIPKELGLRHRAALGITHESDCIAIVVSEETGGISVAVHSELQLRLSAEKLESILTEKMGLTLNNA